MKTPLKSALCASLTILAASAHCKIVIVNSESVNANYHQGFTNLAYAISILADGDTIQFNIPNTSTNRHYLPSPSPVGFPVIVNNNVTIDGYSQPGSSASTNTILAPNNAQIRIVIDARNGALAGYNPDPSGGFGSHEFAVLFVQGTNCHIRGLCFLGPGQTFGGNDGYGVGITYGADDTWIEGCWFGVDLDGQSVFPFECAVAAFGGTGTSSPLWPQRTVLGVKAGPANTAAARGQHNIFCGNLFHLAIESRNSRVSGNFFNVLPDGLHDVSQADWPLESMMEYGREINNLVIGTDGDGLNDAEERNVFGGVTQANDDNIIEFYGAGEPSAAFTNVVIAGNYFGLGVDGVTRFTNSMVLVDNFQNQNGIRATVQFGSDLNGVSDAIEGNVIYMNNPFNVLFAAPFGSSPPPVFFKADIGAQVSVRGNRLVNNNLAPFTYANGFGSLLNNFTNYEALYMSVDGDVVPNLSPSSSPANLIGTCAATNGIMYTDAGGNPFYYSNIFVDVYVLDPEGWTNGQQFGLAELTDASTYTNGFAQGRTYLGSFVDNGPLDSDPAVGSFNFNAASLGLTAGTAVTVTANYSADPPGTAHSRTHTSNFSNPVTLQSPIRITSISRSGSNLIITWSGGTGPFTLQKKSVISGTWSNAVTGIVGPSATNGISGTQGYYRVTGN